MAKLATLDFNGTVLADTQAIIDAGNHTIELFGGTPLSRSEYQKRFYFPTLDFYCEMGCNREALVAGNFPEVFHNFYEERAAKCRTRSGARELLEWLDESSIDAVILSNHVTDKIHVQLERLGLQNHFAEVLGNPDRGATAIGNNKVHRMRNYLRRNGCDPSEAYIVGDSPEDILIGRNLGMHTIAITGGYFSASRLRDANPEHIITSLAMVIDIIKGH